MFRVNSKKEIDSNAIDKCGVYRIFWIKNGIRSEVKRIGGIDYTGLLYIGHTQGSLRDRLNHFRCSAFLNSTNHSEVKNID